MSAPATGPWQTGEPPMRKWVLLELEDSKTNRILYYCFNFLDNLEIKLLNLDLKRILRWAEIRTKP